MMSAKLVISTKDGSTGYAETWGERDLFTGRVFFLADAATGYLDTCQLDAFNIEGKRARKYGTVWRIEDLMLG